MFSNVNTLCFPSRPQSLLSHIYLPLLTLTFYNIRAYNIIFSLQQQLQQQLLRREERRNEHREVLTSLLSDGILAVEEDEKVSESLVFPSLFYMVTRSAFSFLSSINYNILKLIIVSEISCTTSVIFF